ncbi:methyltransferase domain-containing protein [Thermococcus sp.]|uniref:methyltransferase domain-containing protein n=1 Tax=Thermococcus sp. TaxID=35749 RepID=UPI002617D691|nr:methyltransferase domain-containing protein [Thermococcus sp.]
MIEEEGVKLALEVLRKGRNPKGLGAKLGKGWEEAVEIARARLRAGNKFSRDDLWMDMEGLRYATHEAVAKYRSERLKKSGVRSLADVSCGVGIQLIFYAMNLDRAWGIDIDPRRVEYARRNAEKYGVTNIEFIAADSLSPETVGRIDADVVFSDPARPPVAPERKLEGLLPSPLDIHRIYREKTDLFIFDLPPQIRREKIPWKGEFEYIDLNGALNRLTFYFEGLARTERSAVLLPAGMRIESRPELENVVGWTNLVGHYLYEISPAVAYADLINELFHLLPGNPRMLLKDKRRVIGTGSDEIKSEYLKRTYAVVDVVPFHPVRINDILRREGFGKATLRVSVPDSEYWSLRRRIESGLRGDRRAFIFEFNRKAIIAEPL